MLCVYHVFLCKKLLGQMKNRQPLGLLCSGDPSISTKLDMRCHLADSRMQEPRMLWEGATAAILFSDYRLLAPCTLLLLISDAPNFRLLQTNFHHAEATSFYIKISNMPNQSAYGTLDWMVITRQLRILVLVCLMSEQRKFWR